MDPREPTMPEPRFEVTTLGEMLVRLSVPSGRRLEHASQLDVHPAGAEANVVTLLSRLERRTCWLGALPQNPLGRLAFHALRTAGVDASGIHWKDGGRMGTYYVELGEPPRGIQVTYDRAHSCAAELQGSEIDWDLLLNSRLLHLTGITPALSSSCLEIVGEAIERAKAQSVPLSFDINYRQKLWSESDAAQTLLPFIRGAELLFCSQADAARLFHCTGSMQEVAQGMLELTRAKYVTVSFSDQGALLWNGQEWLHEKAPPTRIVDRLGAGDALAAGVIHGWLDKDLAAGLRYGVTLAALALSQVGDMVITTKSELLALSSASSTLTR
jgi:2-dehydro-3-deoxygluconokinase